MSRYESYVRRHNTPAVCSFSLLYKCIHYCYYSYYYSVKTNNRNKARMCTRGAPKKSPLCRIHEYHLRARPSHFTGNFLTYHCFIAVCKRRAEGGRFLPGRNCTRVCVRLIGLTYGPGEGKGERRRHLCTNFFDAIVSPKITRANTYHRPFPASSPINLSSPKTQR